MAVFKCEKCGGQVDTRCKPKKCPQCGESGCMCKEEAPKPTKAEAMGKFKELAKELDAKLYPTNKPAKKK